MRAYRFLSVLFVCGCLIQPVSAADETIEGFWVGAYVKNGQETLITVTFMGQGEQLSARLDKPNQSVQGMQLSKVRYAGSRIQFTLLEEMDTFHFSAQLVQGRINGTYKRGDDLGDFYLYKVVHVPTDVFMSYEGNYQFSQNKVVEFKFEQTDSDYMLYYLDAEKRIRLYPLTTSTFMSANYEIIMFGKNKTGHVVGLSCRTKTEGERPASRIEG